MGKREPVLLKDGRQVVSGLQVPFGRPCLRPDTFDRKIRCGVCVEFPEVLAERGKQHAQGIALLEICLPGTHLNIITVPKVKWLNKNLWTDDLLAFVGKELDKWCREERRELQQEAEKVVGWIKGKLPGLLGQEKIMWLEKEGYQLIGSLWWSAEYSVRNVAGYQDLHVWGRVKGPHEEQPKEVILFTVLGLRRHTWPNSRVRPTYKKSEFWCEKLEHLVVKFLRELVNFSASPVKERLQRLVNQMTRQSEWGQEFRKLLDDLWKLPLEKRGDRRIIKAFSLLKEVIQEGVAQESA